MFIACVLIASFLCVFYLLSKNGSRRQKVLEFVWWLPALECAILSCIFNTSEWQYSETTNWAVRGPITRGPGFNLVAYFFAQLILTAAAAYLIARIIKVIYINISGKVHEQPLPSGEKRAKGSIMYPVCYVCNKPKSLMHDYPSKIYGKRICFDCKKELKYDVFFSTQEQVEIWEGKSRFRSADEVIAYLRKKNAEEEERLSKIQDHD